APQTNPAAPQPGPRRPGPGLLATFGRHRPGRPATLWDYQTMKTSGLRPEPRPSEIRSFAQLGARKRRRIGAGVIGAWLASAFTAVTAGR
ncbi:hypothetical protein, partial [Micromonospora sp. NPDC005806]|uniref:hypothetical protein n=1 Tax=Micromonospora sp. NPDC005806 TaxID=3364234 RepID=UPI00369731A8